MSHDSQQQQQHPLQAAGGAPFRARRYAIKLSPPSIFLEYEDPDGKRRVRAVKLVNISASTDVDRLARKVIRSFPRRLDTASVKYEQVRKLVFKLVESVRQQQQHAGAAGLLGVQVAGVGATADQPHTNQPALTSPVPALSPKLSNPQLARVQGQLVAGGELRHSSESRFSTSTDGGLVDASDLQGFVEQQHGQAHGGGGSAGGVSKPHDTLDDLDDVLGELDRELGGGAGGAGGGGAHLQGSYGAAAAGALRPRGSGDLLVEPARTSWSGTQQHLPSRLSNSGNNNTGGGGGGGGSKRGGEQQGGPSRLAPPVPAAPAPGPSEPQRPAAQRGAVAAGGGDDSDDDGALVLDVDLPEDLNKVTEVELQLAKARMEQDFQRNQIRPGHKDYEYDKQVEFAPATESNEWDED